MNFYKLSHLLKETGYDSQVVPGGQTVAQQPMQAPTQPAAQAQNVGNQQAAPAQPVQAQDINHLLQKVSSKLGNNVHKYQHLVTYLKSKPEMLELFSQALEDVGGMQSSTFQSIN